MTNAVKIAQPEAPQSSVAYHEPANETTGERIVVIGAGPVGIRFAFELLKRRPEACITVFGNEAAMPYNRVQLSALLAGELAYDDISTLLPDAERYPNFSHAVKTVRKIDCENKKVVDINGDEHTYDKLVIATGSRPHVPNIPGVDQQGVYTFRSLKDAEFLYSRISRTRHVVVVGGGLLGLESARALMKWNTKVTLVQQGPRLMNRNLDENAARILRKTVEDLGIRIVTNSGVRSIEGDGRVTAVVTRDKERIECDTVLLCAGIKPNLEIARNAKIKVGKAVLVDDQLKTSDPNIFAIGECCEHRGSTYGLVNPGFEQAAILADNFTNGHARYQGSLEVSRLKVIGQPVCSMGQVSEFERRPKIIELKYQKNSLGIYRKIILNKGRLIGAVGIGEWEESRRIQEAYQTERRFWPWHILGFLITGKLFSASQTDNVSVWPRAAIICQCNNISKGEIDDAMATGSATVAKIQKETGAGTVCGSCKPLVSQLVGDSGPAEKQRSWQSILMVCLLAAACVLTIMLEPAMQVSDTVQVQNNFESIWNDKFWKQVTGFSLLGMSVLGLLMSLRKKLKSKRLGEFSHWRLLHIFLGAFCACTLIMHTGLHLGANFNQILMLDFLAVILLGACAGTVLSLSHKLDMSLGKKLREFWIWAHILVTWPLPILIGMHILTVYYF